MSGFDVAPREPFTDGDVSVVAQRNVGMRWWYLAILVGTPLLIALVVYLTEVVPPVPEPALATVLGVALFTLWLYLGVGRTARWWGCHLRIDDSGIRLGGSSHAETAPRAPVTVARQPYFAPWAAISDVRIVRGRAATRTMVRLATTASVEASKYPGYFPSVGRPLLTLRVDPELVTFAPHSTSMTPSLTWAVPVKGSRRS